MDTRDLDYLLAVQRAGSIAHAAEALGITQPALTKAVQRIEAQTGMPLFERSPRGMVPSTAGKVFLQRARRISVEYMDALNEMRAMHAGELGQLRIGYSLAVSDAVIGACHRLLLDRPAAQLKLRAQHAHEVIAGLLEGATDVVVCTIPSEPVPGTIGHELFQDQVHIVADATHPLHRRQGLSLEDLVDEQWMLPPSTSVVRREMEALFRARGLPAPVVRVETDFANSSLHRLLEGTRMLSGARLRPQGHAASPGLRALDMRAGEWDLSRRIGLLHRQDAYLPPLAHRLMELLRDSAPA